MLIRFHEMNDTLYRNVMYIAKTTSKVSVLIDTIDDQQLICLVSPTDTSFEQDDFIHFMETIQLQMSERFGIDHMYIGCSYLNYDYSTLTQSYDEAQKVVHIKANGLTELKHAFFQHQLGFYRHLDVLFQHGQELASNPALSQIRLYDKQHSTSLYDTLDAFLNKDGNMNETAKDLHIHVNTLSYRLKRIQEITKVDLKDPIQRIGLFLDLKLKKPPTE